MDTTMDSNECLQVFVRCRPLLESEMQLPVPVEIHAEVNKIIIRDVGLNKNAVKAYSYDKVFSPEAGQATVYNGVAASIIQEVLMGFNCTILAYGQTGTGKTFTIEGDRSDAINNFKENPNAGIIPRSMKHIFDELTRLKYDFDVNVSFLELYNEDIFDLLSKADDLTKLKLYDSSKGSVTVQGLEIRKVKSMEDVYQVLDKGCKKRRKAATLLNKMSSRSHTVFTVIVKMREKSTTIEKIKTGKLNLVDLAGSENIGRSGAVEKRAREAGNINQSLLSLGRVITALCENAIHIPYRESKLTRLLRDSLGGQTKTTVIATISPSIFHLDETLNTLEYALRAKNIMNKPEVNSQVSATALTKDYLVKICALEREIKELSSKVEFQVDRDNLKYLETAIETKNTELREEYDMREKLIAESLELDEAILQATETLRLKELEWQKCISDQNEVSERILKEKKKIQIVEGELQILDPVKAKLHQKLHKVMKENEELTNEVKKMEEITSQAEEENDRLQKQFSNMCKAHQNFNEALLLFKNQLENSIEEIQMSIMCDETKCDEQFSSLESGFDSLNQGSENVCQYFKTVISDVEQLKSNLRNSLTESLQNEEMQAKERQLDIKSNVSSLKPCNLDPLSALLTSCEEDISKLFQSLIHWRDTFTEKLDRQHEQLNSYMLAEEQNIKILMESCKDVTQKEEEFIQKYSELISSALSDESKRQSNFDEKMNVLEGALEQLQNFFTEILDADVDKSILAHDKFREHAECKMRNVDSLLNFCDSSSNATKLLKEELLFPANHTLHNELEDAREIANRAIAKFKELVPESTNFVNQIKNSDECIRTLEDRLLEDRSRRTEMIDIISHIENFKDNLMEKDQSCRTIDSEHKAELETLENKHIASLKEAQDSFNRLNDTFTKGVSGNISSIENSDTCGFSWKEDILNEDYFNTTLLSTEDGSNEEETSALDVTFTLPQENRSNKNETSCKFCKIKNETVVTESSSSSVCVVKPIKTRRSRSFKQEKKKKEISFSELVETWCKELFNDVVDDDTDETSDSSDSSHTD